MNISHAKSTFSGAGDAPPSALRILASDLTTFKLNLDLSSALAKLI
jgi:hypothetical protein